jgi:hypothetical protein
LALTTIYTIYNITDFIERERRRPIKTSTNVAVARKPFGDEARKKIKILVFINNYNYKMGSVDIAN